MDEQPTVCRSDLAFTSFYLCLGASLRALTVRFTCPSLKAVSVPLEFFRFMAPLVSYTKLYSLYFYGIFLVGTLLVNYTVWLYCPAILDFCVLGTYCVTTMNHCNLTWRLDMNRSATYASNIHYSKDKRVVILQYTIPLGNPWNYLVAKLSACFTLQKTQYLGGHLLLWIFLADDCRWLRFPQH
jgi:hypothetical protein